MGRQLYRVDLDFNWPLKQVWEGFINPYAIYCHECEYCRNGYNEYGQWLNDLWYGFNQVNFKPEDNGSTPFTPTDAVVRKCAEWNIHLHPEYYGNGEQAILNECQRLCEHFNSAWSHHLNQDDVNALIEAERLWNFTRVPLHEPTEEDIRTHAYFLWLKAGCPNCDGVEFWEKSVEFHKRHWLPYNNGCIPTAKEVNEWSLRGLGHDSINANVCIRARAKRENKSYVCEKCNGHGTRWESDKYKKLYDEWQSSDPPAGEGYQIWENVSEGSPVSPVFATAEELAQWMVDNDRSVTKDVDYYGWMKFINGPGWAPSMIGTSEGFKSGVTIWSTKGE